MSYSLSVPNPRYADKIKRFPHLAGVTMDDEDTKPELPIENYFALFCQPASDIKSSVVLPFIKGVS